MDDLAARADALARLGAEAAACARCALAAGRTQVVFGRGSPDAELMLVGEAPGYQEDRRGLPFAGPAGELLDRLLATAGIGRGDVYEVNVLKCRPPGNRDPLVEELAACDPYLFRQVELVRPRVIASLGTVATRLLSGRELGLTRVHGREQQVTVAGRAVTLLPLYHPAAALYTPAMLRILEEDFARLPELLGRPLAEPVRRLVPVAVAATGGAEPVQLGLF